MPDDARAHEKWRAYPETLLVFDAPHPLRVDLRESLSDAARRELAAAGWANAFAVLTAENPAGDNSDDAATASDAIARERANRRRRATLREELRSRGVRTREVVGSAPDGSYPEQCVAVDLPLEDALRLTREWDQLAIFWFDGLRFWLVPAELGATPVALPGKPAD